MTPLRLTVTASAAADAHSFASFTLPLPRGRWRETPGIRLTNREGCAVPLQAKSFVQWPDGSQRMVRIDAVLPGGLYELTLEEDRQEAMPGLALREGSGGGVEVVNGGEVYHFTPEGALETVFINGVRKGEGGVVQVQVRGEGGEGYVSTPEGPAKVLEAEPLSAVVEQWVRASGAEAYLRFRCRFRFFAGVPGVRLEVMVVNDAPGSDFQTLESIELIVRPKGMPTHTVHQSYGGYEYTESRFAQTQERFDIRVDGTRFTAVVHNFEAMGDKNVYPHYLVGPPSAVADTVFLEGPEGALMLAMQDFRYLRPKGIVLEEGAARLAIWPEWAGPVRWQQGRRRQVTLALVWQEQVDSLATAQGQCAALWDHFRCQLPPEVYAEAEFFDLSRVLRSQPRRYPIWEGWFSAVSELTLPTGFFDFGDTPDTGYQTTYIPVGFSDPVRSDFEARPTMSLIRSRFDQPRCFEHLDDYERIWVNNEYDVLFCLGTEYLRSENREHFRLLSLFARHTIEVDFVVYSDHELTHRAQPPHCRHHTSAGAYPSHFWTQGLAQYYFLTGDDDALEVIRALADKTIWYLEHPVFGGYAQGLNREMGWSVLSLVYAGEATGEARYDEMAGRILDAAVKEPLPTDLPELSFAHTSLLLGVRAYLQSHGHPDGPVKEFFLRFTEKGIGYSLQAPPEVADDFRAPALTGPRGAAWALKQRAGIISGFMAPDCLAYAWEQTGDRRYLEAALRALQLFRAGAPGYFEGRAINFFNPTPEGKPFAVAYRTWVNYLGALDRAGMLPGDDEIARP